MKTEIKTARRYFKDRHHAYGWEIGFKSKFSDGTSYYFSSLGTTRRNALGHYIAALRQWCERTSP